MDFVVNSDTSRSWELNGGAVHYRNRPKDGFCLEYFVLACEIKDHRTIANRHVPPDILLGLEKLGNVWLRIDHHTEGIKVVKQVLRITHMKAHRIYLPVSRSDVLVSEDH